MTPPTTKPHSVQGQAQMRCPGNIRRGQRCLTAALHLLTPMFTLFPERWERGGAKMRPS